MSKRSKEAIKLLKVLPKNWDSYGAKSFSKNLCEMIEIIINEAEDVGLDWELEPQGDGRVALIFGEEPPMQAPKAIS
jgi:hypothetical protein